MVRHILPYVDLLSYCLMPNHFHWPIRVRATTLPVHVLDPKFAPSGRMRSLNHSIGILLRSYARAINIQYGWSGSLFRERTKAKCGMDNNDLWFGAEVFGQVQYANRCFHYIHLNPVKADLVDEAEDWPYSSASDYSGLCPDSICNLALGRKLFAG